MSQLLSIKQRFGIIGRSELLDRALDTAIRVAPTDLTVLISGESGVGKEVFSKIIHQLSPRKHNNFIAVNCGAIPAGTINSELFGHEKGAFTGAMNERKGYFETVDGGTIFLDEIGDMPLDTQAFLLRVLESGEFLRVGSSKVLHSDVRVIAATNVDLLERIRRGKFREDLYYRLSTVPIKLPALHERPEDIPILFRKFSTDFAEKYRATTIQPDDKAMQVLQSYRWPGNIRELKNLAEQLSILSENKLVNAETLVEHFPQLLKRNLPAIADQPLGNGDSFSEREILYKLLFEMRVDLSDLKSLVFELIRTNDLQFPENSNIRSLTPAQLSVPQMAHDVDRSFAPAISTYHEPATSVSAKPIILDSQHKQEFSKTEVVEESLSLMEMEIEMINKALKKHKSRRKEAADELGISERTLYRKIKEYNIDL
jgi:DNA-binding NtrC family response regulator